MTFVPSPPDAGDMHPLWKGWFSNVGRALSSAIGTINISSPPPGGSVSALIPILTNGSVGIYIGTGAPTIAAGQGSLYIRTDGNGPSNRMYVNTNGLNGWTAFLTVL